ncbi:hypothetical protein [Serratia marcescens]|uniref:hypothetical protein n=1 Tax=Serratia marcescens TaxID=615 RepID=UPI0011165544|nr:hypothetical protein [Serratia marcescens]
MDKSATELYTLIKKHDGISYNQLCAATLISSARVCVLLRFMVKEGVLYRSGLTGQFRYHISKPLADKAGYKPQNLGKSPEKRDIVTSCKSLSGVYKFDQLLLKAKENYDRDD